MRAPRLIGILVCLFSAFAVFQSWMWQWRPEPGWQASWWQSHTLATIGFFLSLPAAFPAMILGTIGVTNILAERAAFWFGFIVELALIYGAVHSVTKFFFRFLRSSKSEQATAVTR